MCVFSILDFGIVGFWVCLCLVEFSGCLDLGDFWILGFWDLRVVGIMGAYILGIWGIVGLWDLRNC